MSIPYPYQSIDHDASITAQRDTEDPSQITIEIVVGEHAETRITVWDEDLAHMITSLGPLGPAQEADQ